MDLNQNEERYKYYILAQKLDDISFNLTLWSMILSSFLTIIPVYIEINPKIMIVIIFSPIILTGLISLIFKIILFLKKLRLDRGD